MKKSKEIYRINSHFYYLLILINIQISENYGDKLFSIYKKSCCEQYKTLKKSPTQKYQILDLAKLNKLKKTVERGILIRNIPFYYAKFCDVLQLYSGYEIFKKEYVSLETQIKNIFSLKSDFFNTNKEEEFKDYFDERNFELFYFPREKRNFKFYLQHLEKRNNKK